MRLSNLLRTRPSANEADGDLLARAGYTHRLADGLYTLLPLGHRVLQRICAIAREEIARTGAQELTMPLLQPRALWDQHHPADRASRFGRELFRLEGEGRERLVLAPTHEEVAALIGMVSVRNRPGAARVVYQIQPRFRDQTCSPVAGMLQTREFVMADAYSFHDSRASLDETYGAIREAFCRVLARCDLTAEIVQADVGMMGGEMSEEMVVQVPSLAVAAVRCSQCSYSSSIEVAECQPVARSHEKPLALSAVRGGEDLFAADLVVPSGIPSARRLIAIPFVAAERVFLVVMRGDHLLNTAKLVKALSHAGIDTSDCHRASGQELTSLGGSYDWISLVRTPSSVAIIADDAVRSGGNFVFPSPRSGHFLINLNAERDFRVDMFVDLRLAANGTACPACGNPVLAIRGIEVGHIFKLGAMYTAAFASQSEAGAPPVMGCYGLGITRLMATIAEQKRDERGLVWPDRLAPFAATLMPLQREGDARSAAEQRYYELESCGFDVLLDDSDGEPEQMRRLADLLGIPFTIGCSGDPHHPDIVEMRDRVSRQPRRVAISEVRALLSARA